MRVCVSVAYCSPVSSTDPASQHTSGVDTAAYQENPLKCFVWSGPTVQRLTLGPASSHEVQQRACFVGAGAYNLNVLRVSAGSTTDIVMVPQRCLSAAPIIINDITVMAERDSDTVTGLLL